MTFPVDILVAVDPGSLEQSAKNYMSKLLYKNSKNPDHLSGPGSEKIAISPSNVSLVPLYGADIKQKILAVFSPEEPLKAVGLYLLERWWSAEDIIKTADSTRTGLIKVRTIGERIVLYVLNRIIYRTKEMVGSDVPFPCHGEDEIAKILWKNGEAIGFYSVKPEVPGRLSNKFLTQHYQLPVLDTIFIRKSHRGHGHALQMLKDFVNSFEMDFMGLSSPLSPAMYKVCKKYLSLYPEDTELLWEIVGVGSPFQIARKIQAIDPKGNRQTNIQAFNSKEADIPKEIEITQVQETMEFIKVVEEVVQIKTTKDSQDTPVIALGRSSALKRKIFEADEEEIPEKIIRNIDPDVQCAEEDQKQEDSNISLPFKESERKDTTTTTHDLGYPISNITYLHYEGLNKLSPDLSHHAEKEDKLEAPFVEILNLNSNDLQTLEHQQVVEVEVVKMPSKMEEVKEKVGKVKQIKSNAGKMLLTSEGIIQGQKNETDLAESASKDVIAGRVEMGKISVVEHIVDDSEKMEVEEARGQIMEIGKERSKQVKEKHPDEESGMVQESLKETVMQEPRPNNEEEKMIQQEENSNSDFSSGSKSKRGDKRRSNYKTPPRHARSRNDPAAEAELTGRALRSSSKKTIKYTLKQMDFGQSKSTQEPELLKHVEEPTESEPAEINSDNNKLEVSNTNLIVAPWENEEEKTIKKDHLTQPTNDDQALMEVDDDSQVAQDKVTVEAEEAGKTTQDAEKISQIEETDETLASKKASATTDGDHMKEGQKETDTDQQTPGEQPKRLHLFESSEGNESDKSDVRIILDEEEEAVGSSVTPLRRSKTLKDTAAGSQLTKSVLRRSARLSNKFTARQSNKPQIKALMQLERPEQQVSENNELNVMLESEVAVGEQMDVENVHVFAEADPEYRVSFVQNTWEEERHLEKNNSEADDHENTENMKKSYKNDVEENIRREDVAAQEQTPSRDVTHGETEQICIPGENSATDSEVFEHVKDVGGKVEKEDAAREMMHREDQMETTSTVALQKASIVLVDVVNVQRLTETSNKEETAATVEMGMDNSLITIDEQDEVIHAEDTLDEIKANTIKVGTAELDTNKTLEESQAGTVPALGDSVWKSSDDADISECTSRNLIGRMTLAVTPTSERKSRRLQNVSKETKVSTNTEEISDEEIETVFTRYLRGRIVTVTPRRRSKQITATAKATTDVEEMHGTSFKYETSSVSEVERKDQHQDNKDLPGKDSEKIGGKATVEKADDYEEVETKLSAINRSITEAVLAQSEVAETSVKSKSARRSERLRRQPQGGNVGQTAVWANTDPGKGQETYDANSVGGEISHDHENQDKTEDMTEFENVSGDFLSVTDYF